MLTTLAEIDPTPLAEHVSGMAHAGEVLAGLQTMLGGVRTADRTGGGMGVPPPGRNAGHTPARGCGGRRRAVGRAGPDGPARPPHRHVARCPDPAGVHGPSGVPAGQVGLGGRPPARVHDGAAPAVGRRLPPADRAAARSPGRTGPARHHRGRSRGRPAVRRGADRDAGRRRPARAGGRRGVAARRGPRHRHRPPERAGGARGAARPAGGRPAPGRGRGLGGG